MWRYRLSIQNPYGCLQHQRPQPCNKHSECDSNPAINIRNVTPHNGHASADATNERAVYWVGYGRRYVVIRRSPSKQFTTELFSKLVNKINTSRRIIRCDRYWPGRELHMYPQFRAISHRWIFKVCGHGHLPMNATCFIKTTIPECWSLQRTRTSYAMWTPSWSTSKGSSGLSYSYDNLKPGIVNCPIGNETSCFVSVRTNISVVPCTMVFRLENLPFAMP